MAKATSSRKPDKSRLDKFAHERLERLRHETYQRTRKGSHA